LEFWKYTSTFTDFVAFEISIKKLLLHDICNTHDMELGFNVVVWSHNTGRPLELPPRTFFLNSWENALLLRLFLAVLSFTLTN